MAITSSRVDSDIVQANGRRSILEIYTDDQGKDHHRMYKASANYVVNLSAGAVLVSAQLVVDDNKLVERRQYRRAQKKIKAYLQGENLRTLASLTPAENTQYRRREFGDA